MPSAEDQPHREPELVGVWHDVKPGETLWRISRAYGVLLQDLAEYNNLARPEDLAAGARIFVPGAQRRMDVPALVTPTPPPEAGSSGSISQPAHEPVRQSSLAWPVEGVLYSPFGVRDGVQHDGVDIAAPEGTPVVAAAAGRVAFAGEQRGYGRLVILAHDSGFVTIYAHAREVLVAEGAQVARGQVIARVGRTGRATGPHLHFEVREGARPRNPLFFLP